MRHFLPAIALLTFSSAVVNAADTEVLSDVATFEDLKFAEGSKSWFGDTSATDYTESLFTSGAYSFVNQYTPEYGSWAAFAYTCETGNTYTNFYTDQYFSAPGGALGGSGNFAICYVSDFNGTPYLLHNIYDATRADEDPTIIPGAWFTASAWTKDNVLNGDGMSGKFEKGDWFKVTLRGHGFQTSTEEEAPVTGEVEIYLADYRSDNELDHHVIDTWQWIDLSPLGEAHKVTLHADGSKQSEWGLTTASYIAIDNFGDRMPVVEKEVLPLPVDFEGVSTLPYFSFDANEGTILVEAVSIPEGVELKDGRLIRSEEMADLAAGCVLHASQRGHHEYVRIPLADANGVESVVDAPVMGWSIAGGVLRVSCPGNDSVTLVAADGRVVASAEAVNGMAVINTTDLPAGAYIITGNGNTRATKIMIR